MLDAVAIIATILSPAIHEIFVQESGLRDELERDRFDLALQAALTPAYSKFVQKHGQWSDAFFDKHFLKDHARPVLARCLMRGHRPEGVELATAWANHIGLKDDSPRISEFTPIASEFLGWFEEELRKQPEFQQLFDSRALDKTAAGVTELVKAVKELPMKLTEELTALVASQRQALETPQEDEPKVTVESLPSVVGELPPPDAQQEVGVKIEVLPTGYQPPTFHDSVYNFENRTQDIARIFSFLESNPYLHLYGPSGIGKTNLAVQLLQQRYGEHNKAYLDFNDRKYHREALNVERLLGEIQHQFYNTKVSTGLRLSELAQKAKECFGYGIVILDNIDRIAPGVRRKLCEEIFPSLQDQIRDPKRYLRIIAVAQTQLEELRGSAKSIYFQPYPLAGFGGMNHDLRTYKRLLMQAIERFANGLLDPKDPDDDKLLIEWACTLYDLTGGHPGAIEETLNYVGEDNLFVKSNIFEKRREAICKYVLAPRIEQQVQACLPNPKYQQAFRQLWVFRYLSKGVFRQVLRTVKDKDHWNDLNAITGPADYEPKYAPLWERFIETPLLQSEGIERSRLLSHQLSPIWRKQGNLILQVAAPALYQKLHGDAFAVFEHFALGETTRNINMRISCFVEALYHLTQRNRISASMLTRSDLTQKIIEYFYIFLLLLEEEEEFFDENLYQVKKLLQSDQELQAELNQVGQQDTYQQISHIIRQKISYD
ncbi:MAG: hypothetical protein ACPGWR_02045 [Ardenticatenaceae bacterium]